MGIDRILKDRKTASILNTDIINVLQKHSGMMVHYECNKPTMLYGNYRLFDNNGIEQGNWDIKIPIPTNYPYEFPKLIETSRKIEASPDTHMDQFGNACTELDIISQRIAKKGISLTDFLETYVSKYFSWQILYSNGETENLESWKHANDGKAQFLMEKIDTLDVNFAGKCLEMIKNRKFLKRNELCPCGSNIKYKNCHQPRIEQIQVFDLKELEIYFNEAILKNG